METKKKRTNVIVSVSVLAGLLLALALATAGNLQPTSPLGPTMHTLNELYDLYSSTSEGGKFVPSVDRGPSDIFVKFEGVDGEAQDKDHKSWIDVISFNQKHSAPVEGSGLVRQRGAVAFQDVLIVKTIDKASPKLAEALCIGTVFPKVEIHLTSSYTDAGRVAYLVYELKNVLVTSYNVGGSGQSEDVPTEQVSLNFEEIKVTYTECDDTGASKGNVEYTWKVEEGDS